MRKNEMTVLPKRITAEVIQELKSLTRPGDLKTDDEANHDRAKVKRICHEFGYDYPEDLISDFESDPVMCLLTAIAKAADTGIVTLEERKSDSLDFYDIHVCTLRSMMRAAYAAGLVDGKATK